MWEYLDQPRGCRNNVVVDERNRGSVSGMRRITRALEMEAPEES
jgi:hypothetical protein